MVPHPLRDYLHETDQALQIVNSLVRPDSFFLTIRIGQPNLALPNSGACEVS